MRIFLLFAAFLLVVSGARAQGPGPFPVVVIGGGASGTAAAVTAARSGQRVLLIERGPWLGGMLTAAGVSAIDGNHDIAGGIWREFRDSLRAHYGGAHALATGWVSYTLFEPKIGQRILRNMVEGEPNIELRMNTDWADPVPVDGGWQLTAVKDSLRDTVRAGILIDATELGDVAAAVGVPYDVGMDAREETGEAMAPETANDIIQDLTYVVTLRDYGPGQAPLLKKPVDYDPAAFRCACDTADPAGDGAPRIDCNKMLDYGKLPNGRYMVNWPNCGNDYYTNLIPLAPADRARELQKAKQYSLRFVYFLQHELGFDHLGIDTTQYPTADGLPLIPYHRESRRIHGLVRFDVNDLTAPHDQADALYRTSVAVGDYPIDHHHKMRPDAPAIDFIRIKAPAYGLPLGTLIPKNVPNLIVAEKSISVTNIVNGTTRLQPVVLGIGQAAGTLATLAAQRRVTPSEVPVRAVQSALLDQGAFLLPFRDVGPDHPDFKLIQRIALTGMLRGKGLPYKWANQLWFYPDWPMSEAEFVRDFAAAYPGLIREEPGSGAPVTLTFLQAWLRNAPNPYFTELDGREPLTRVEIARVLEDWYGAFGWGVDYIGDTSPPAPLRRRGEK